MYRRDYQREGTARRTVEPSPAKRASRHLGIGVFHMTIRRLIKTWPSSLVSRLTEGGRRDGPTHKSVETWKPNCEIGTNYPYPDEGHREQLPKRRVVERHGCENKTAHAGPDDNQLSKTHAILDLVSAGVNRQVSKSERAQHIPVADKPEHTAYECNVVSFNRNRTGAYTAQAVSKMGRQNCRVNFMVEIHGARVHQRLAHPEIV
jgi:hypothetical protein